MNSKAHTINLIQDLATPHNNVLISAFKGRTDCKLNLWYALDQDRARYQWDINISHEHFPAVIYGNRINWQFIKYCLTHPEERFVIVGWMNINTKLITLLFFLLRRPFNHWTDNPNSAVVSSNWKKLRRWFSYKLLKHSQAMIFCAGITCMDYFRKLGFSSERLVNLPIFIKTDEDILECIAKRDRIFAKYSITQNDFVLSAGSRIIHEKGYDLLIRAIALLEPDVRSQIKVVVVGSGVCIQELEGLISELSLSQQVILEKWLEFDEFKALIANSHAFVHPARFDAYGGTIFAMALGVPVIGSYQAGAAVDRISQGRNGFLYEAEEIQTLANFITLLFQNPELRQRMGREAYKTAMQWQPSCGADIMLSNAI